MLLRHRRRLLLGAAFLIGSLPVAQLVARRDLRKVRTGTVSASNVYAVSGLPAFAVTCALDLGKGALAAALARRRPSLMPAVCGLVVAGHNWSPFLRGAGGRGVLTASGALLVAYPRGALVMAAGVVAGAVTGDTAPGCFAAEVLLTPILARSGGRRAAAVGAAVALPMLAKRLLGNTWPDRSALVPRLVFDRDAR